MVEPGHRTRKDARGQILVRRQESQQRTGRRGRMCHQLAECLEWQFFVEPLVSVSSAADVRGPGCRFPCPSPPSTTRGARCSSAAQRCLWVVRRMTDGQEMSDVVLADREVDPGVACRRRRQGLGKRPLLSPASESSLWTIRLILPYVVAPPPGARAISRQTSREAT